MINDMLWPDDGSLFVRTFEERDPPMIVIDFGANADQISTDTVEDTLIIVDESADQQYEYTLPGDRLRTFMQNGVLTIEVEE